METCLGWDTECIVVMFFYAATHKECHRVYAAGQSRCRWGSGFGIMWILVCLSLSQELPMIAGCWNYVVSGSHSTRLFHRLTMELTVAEHVCQLVVFWQWSHLLLPNYMTSEVWMLHRSAFCEARLEPGLLREFLPRLINVSASSCLL